MNRLLTIMIPASLVIIGGFLQTGSHAAGQSAEEPPPPRIWESGTSIGLDDRGTVLVLESPTPAVGLPVDFQLQGPLDSDVPAPEVTWPTPGTELGDFEVLGTAPSPTIPLEDRRVISTWRIRTFASGRVELPGFDIRLDDRILEVPARTLLIASVAGIDTDPAAHRDITGPIEVDLDTPIAWIWFLIGHLLLVTTIIVVVWWWTRPRPLPPPVPADAWAFEELDKLESRGHLSAGRIHRFYVELTDITRRFIELRYGIAAPERTTPEFAREATRHPLIGEEHARVLGNLLRAADMVKFAGDRPASAEAERHLGFVRDFVGEVGPAPTCDDSDRTGGTPVTSTKNPTGTPDRATAREIRISDAVDDLDRLENRS